MLWQETWGKSVTGDDQKMVLRCRAGNCIDGQSLSPKVSQPSVVRSDCTHLMFFNFGELSSRALNEDLSPHMHADG